MCEDDFPLEPLLAMGCKPCFGGDAFSFLGMKIRSYEEC